MGGGDGEWWVVRVSIRTYKKIEGERETKKGRERNQ